MDLPHASHRNVILSCKKLMMVALLEMGELMLVE